MTERMNSFKDEVEELNEESIILSKRSRRTVLAGVAAVVIGLFSLILLGIVIGSIIEIL
jgi:hypothetical protein